MSREIFAKMAGTLDSNRKIRKAGRDGRDVFLWVLRQVALRDSDGSIPTDDLTDFDYLADQLMCSPADAERGVAAACAAGLLVTDNEHGVTRIVGWSGDWGRRPRSNAERQADFRARHGAARAKTSVDARDVTDAPLPVTEDVTSNPVEESRVEEREGRVTPPLTLVSSEPKPDRVARLWAEQEQLRADAVPGGRALTLTKDRRKLVQAALKAGYSDDDLRALLAARVGELRAQGTTTIEVKSGYALTVEGEARLLRLARELTTETTYLGAHVVPPQFSGRRTEYVDLVCGEMLDACAPYARWVDVFCEPHSPHAFTEDEARAVLAAGIARGLLPRVHGNQLGPGPGVRLAVELGAASVDHCTYLSDADIDQMVAGRTVAREFVDTVTKYGARTALRWMQPDGELASMTFAEVGATGDTITRATGSFITDGFVAGDTIRVTGSSSNNVTGVPTTTAMTVTSPASS